MIRFAYLDKQKKGQVAKQLFSILAANMAAIAPTGNTFEEDFATWSAQVLPALDKPLRQIVCIYNDAELIGYFQYYVNGDLFVMEEIQFLRGYQSKAQLFRRLYAFLLPHLPDGVRYVEAYANKKNTKSQGILTHLGLRIIAEEKSYLHYRGNFSDLAAWVLSAGRRLNEMGEYHA